MILYITIIHKFFFVWKVQKILDPKIIYELSCLIMNEPTYNLYVSADGSYNNLLWQHTL